MRGIRESKLHRWGRWGHWGSFTEVVIGRWRDEGVAQARGKTHSGLPLLGNAFPPIIRGVLETLGLIVAFVLAGLGWAATL